MVLLQVEKKSPRFSGATGKGVGIWRELGRFAAVVRELSAANRDG